MKNKNRVFRKEEEQLNTNSFMVFLRRNSSSNDIGIEEAISKFLKDFNESNGIQFKFKKFLDIYNGRIKIT